METIISASSTPPTPAGNPRIVKCFYCHHSQHLGVKNASGLYKCERWGHLFRFCGTCLHTLAAGAKRCKYCGRSNIS